MEIASQRKTDYIVIETHFGVPGHFIRANTRNKCSEDIVAMLQEVSRILYPNEEFEVFLLPPEPGSYKDIIKFVKKNKVGLSVGTVVAIGGLTLTYLNYKDSHEAHLHDMEMRVVDDTAKCLALKQSLAEIGKDYEIENIPEEKLNEVCGSLNLKKKKNNIFDTLQKDDMVANNETLLKNSEDEVIISEKIERGDFSKYIEPILDQKYEHQNATGIIELISPVVKQKREGQGIAWKGTYYGEDIIYQDVTILKNGEDVDFYMQDPDLKSQINNKERVFASGDNMKIVFDISGEIKGVTILNRRIYIKEVQNYNEEIIPHKEKIAKQVAVADENNLGLFDTLEDN